MKNKSIKLLLYCNKAKPHLIDFKGEYKAYSNFNQLEQLLDNGYNLNDIMGVYNGKIVAEAECDLVEQFNCCCVPYRNLNNFGYEYFIDNGVYKVDWKKGINLVNKNDKYNNPDIYKDEGVVFERTDQYIDTMFKNEDFKNMSLVPQELLDYIGLGKDGYAIYLKNVKRLPQSIKFAKNSMDNDSLFYTKTKDRGITRIGALIRASQNMMHVYSKDGNLYVLIPVHSQEMCDIMNNEKTIIIRKSILNIFKEFMEK